LHLIGPHLKRELQQRRGQKDQVTTNKTIVAVSVKQVANKCALENPKFPFLLREQFYWK
jgi:hypothetical protein